MNTRNIINNENAKVELESLRENGGILFSERTKELCDKLNLSVKELMLALLPHAIDYSVAPISLFNVGAVVRGETCQSIGFPNLYLGANLEFEGLALNYSLHAEQAAVSNAWLAGERAIKGIAITAAPCGHCRQFLYEFVNGAGLPIVLPTDNFADKQSTEERNNKYILLDLNELLPSAFGPNDLDISETPLKAKQTLRFEQAIDHLNEPEIMAKRAAERSYAPYSENYSSCLVQLDSGQEFIGRIAENAAFNPTLSPFVAALSQLVMSGNHIERDQYEFARIVKVILIEQKSKSSNKSSIELMINKICPNAELVYYH
ncbi:MAG: cytidine deaminase [Kangiellaceae bacterium]|nr:cytidine deaminase [Kangiellaceae bacterium]